MSCLRHCAVVCRLVLLCDLSNENFLVRIATGTVCAMADLSETTRTMTGYVIATDHYISPTGRYGPVHEPPLSYDCTRTL